MIVIHHNKDLDGFSSGAICKLKYPDATLIGWDYAEPIPDFEQFRDQKVIMIDVTFPISRIVELSKIVEHLTVIDHHISFLKDYCQEFAIINTESTLALDDIRPNLRYVYNKTKAACETGWEYLFPDIPVPYAITLLGRYDTWRKDEGLWDDATLPFQYYMRLICSSAETFPDYALTNLNGWINGGIDIGKRILEYQKQQDAIACKRSAFVERIGPYKVICLNTRAFSSNTMESVYDSKYHDIMLGFEYTGKTWAVSLRSTNPDIDVSLIAKARGGGGHKAAAGYEAKSFEEIFN